MWVEEKEGNLRMSKPIFSVAFASRRGNFHRSFYNSLVGNSTVPFEVIFVGPQPPTETMPDNFRHIYSKATPAQCTEIAVRNAVGDYILPFSDDMTFSDNFLNRLYNYTLRLDMDKVLIAFRYYLAKSKKYADDGLHFDPDVITSPIIGVSPVFRRDIWNKLGGFDKRFHGTFADMDMQMRFFEYGMNIFITPDCVITEINAGKGYKKRGHPNCSLFLKHGIAARNLLNLFWKKEDGSLSKNRLSPVQSFPIDII